MDGRRHSKTRSPGRSPTRTRWPPRRKRRPKRSRASPGTRRSSRKLSATRPSRSTASRRRSRRSNAPSSPAILRTTASSPATNTRSARRPAVVNRSSSVPANARSAIAASTSATRNSPVSGIDPADRTPDLGLAAITHKRGDNGKFKVPTLREIAHTGPYMHDRRFVTLDAVLEFYRKGGIPGPHLDSRIASFFLDAPRQGGSVWRFWSRSAAKAGSRSKRPRNYREPSFRRRPMIILIRKWSVLPVSPIPGAKLNSQFGPKFKSRAGKIA